MSEKLKSISRTPRVAVRSMKCSAALGWSYSHYRASLYLDGERFAIVTPDGRNSLSKKNAALLLEALNRKPPNGGSVQPDGSAAVWNCTIDGLRMDKEACVQAAREYGYGGNDAVEAVFLLGKWGYEIHIW